MNKKLMAVVAVLCLCMALAACRKKKEEEVTHNPIASETTTQTDGTTTPIDGTEPQTGWQGDPTAPSLESNTEVGTGRVEGGNTTQDPNTSKDTTPTTPDEPPANPDLSISFQQYDAMDWEAQQKFYNKYFAENPLGFAEWYQRIKQEYDDGKTEIIATGPVDIGDYIKP